ncbi:hypothetical protein TP44_21935, partial (plasmid) [Xanthomonas citri pv. citri]
MELGSGGVVEGGGVVIEAAKVRAARLFAADLPACAPVFAASGRGEPAGDGYLNRARMSEMCCT